MSGAFWRYACTTALIACELEKSLFLDSGRDTEIIIATQTRTGAIIAIPVEDALTAALIDGKFDVFILDPAVSIHRVSENDNMAIDAVSKTFGRIAGKANIAIEAVHHTRKLGGQQATIEDAGALRRGWRRPATSGCSTA